jgi:transposase
MQLQLKTVLNHVHPLKGFAYASVELVRLPDRRPHVEATVKERRGSRPTCSNCGKVGACYDHLYVRRFGFVPLWGLMVVLLYSPRRVSCKDCGVRVEIIPWACNRSRCLMGKESGRPMPIATGAAGMPPTDGHRAPWA